MGEVPSFVGEGHVISGITRSMAHPASKAEIADLDREKPSRRRVPLQMAHKVSIPTASETWKSEQERYLGSIALFCVKAFTAVTSAGFIEQSLGNPLQADGPVPALVRATVISIPVIAGTAAGRDFIKDRRISKHRIAAAEARMLETSRPTAFPSSGDVFTLVPAK